MRCATEKTETKLMSMILGTIFHEVIFYFRYIWFFIILKFILPRNKLDILEPKMEGTIILTLIGNSWHGFF